MNTFALLRAEIWHRKMNVLLSLTALVAAATLFVASPTLLDGYRHESQLRLGAMQAETERSLEGMQEETDAQLAKMQADSDRDLNELERRTKRIMRDLGFNLRIVHRDTDLSKLYAGFVAFEMPEEYVERLADSPEITKIVHLVATLKQMVNLEGRSALLVGFAPEATQSHIEKKSPMGYQIPVGQVYLGHVTANGRNVGESVEILGKSFEIARVLPLHGNEEDIAVCMNLRDAQEVLEKPGKISEILALGCKCKTVDRVEEITAQLELVLPDTKVTEMRLQAIARDEQRKLVELHHKQTIDGYTAKRQEIAAAERQNREEILEREEEHRLRITGLLAGTTQVLTPLIVFVCAVWVGLLAWANVRERRTEIGLLRAIGKRSSSIAALFLGKAAILGFVAGAAGSILGFMLARSLGTSMLEVASDSFTPSLLATLSGLLGTPIIAAIASYLPTLAAVKQDPSVVLMDN
jgi:putative ABC transport system permease protein